jgi:hypothetical protein
MISGVARWAALAAVVAVASLAVAPAADAATAKPRAGCTQLREHQTLRVTLSWRYRVRVRYLTSSFSQSVKTLADQTRPFGTLAVAGATCRRPGGRWVVIDPIGVAYSSAGMDPVGNLKSSGLMKGWGIGIRSGAGGSIPRISLQMMHCGRGNFFKTLKTLIGVPIPYLPFAVNVALWGAGQFLPSDKVTCGDVGVKQLRVFANPSGVIRVGDLTPYVGNESKVSGPNPNDTSQRTSETSYDVLPIAVANR